MDKLFKDLTELFRGFGVLFFAGVRFAACALVYVLELCEKCFILGVDLLHYLGIAAAVGVVLEYEGFVLLLEFFEGLRVVEVFHGGFLSCFSFGGLSCAVAPLYTRRECLSIPQFAQSFGGVFGEFVHLTAVHIAVYNIISKGADEMAIKCKIDILDELKKAGYSTYRLRQDKIMGESLIQRIRSGGVPEIVVIDKLCKLLNCRVGDIIEYVEGVENEQ